MAQKTATKDPIKHDPLPNPGESLHEQILDVAFEKAMGWVVTGVVLLAILLLEWFSFLFNLPQDPYLMTVLMVPMVVFCAWRMMKHWRYLTRLKQGLRGERAIGQFLERLRAEGYWVIHDMVERDADGTEFNIDHTLVGPGGIFVIETKTRRKPARGDAIIRYDGECVSVNGGPLDEAPIRQALAGAGRVRQILEDVTGRTNIPVRAVVVFPGWYIEGTSSGRAVWVLNPAALEKWIKMESPRLSTEDVALFRTRLSEHVLRQRERHRR